MKELSFFGTKDVPYYIYGLNYSQKSAGQRALHYLCHGLNELGYEAYITADVTHPGLHTPRLTKAVMTQHQESGRVPIVVYPEVVSGNPLGGKIIVRWLLNRPGHLSGDRFYEDGDIVFAYSAAFLPSGMQGAMLHIPTVDAAIFNNNDNPNDDAREFVCFYANKYLAMGGRLTHHAANAVSLGQDVKLTPPELAEILRRSRLLYIYEPTAMMNEALLCGCPVCVIQSDYWKENTANTIFAQGIGIAMEDTKEAIALARETVGNYGEAYAKNIALAWDQIRRFIAITQWRARKLMWQSVTEVHSQIKPAAVEFTHDPAYALWLATHRDANTMKLNAERLAPFAASAPAFLLVIPLIEGHEDMLAATLDSVVPQNFANWRACVLAHTSQIQDLPDDHRIEWATTEVSGFAHEFNKLINSYAFDWLILLEAGDTLEAHALSTIAVKSSQYPQWQLIYSDEDGLTEQGLHERPFFKPDYQIDLHRSAPFMLNVGVAIKRMALTELNGFDRRAEGAELFDLILRGYERYGGSGIGHIADILYHRTESSGHSMLSIDEGVALRRDILSRHLDRLKQNADVLDGPFTGTFRIRYHHDGLQQVSIIIPTRNGGTYLQRCVGAIVDNTEYAHWEIIVVDQGSDDPETRAFLEQLRVVEPARLQVLDLPQDTGLAEMINTGVKAAHGRYLLFLSDASAPVQRDWLDEMLGLAQQTGIGVVGAKTLGPDGRVSFAGYILGLDGKPAGQHDLYAEQDYPGYFGQLMLTRNPSAVSASCMLTQADLFASLGGFDETLPAGGYSDVDYCLKVEQSGRRVVWTPHVLILQEHMYQPPAEPHEEEQALSSEVPRLWHIPNDAERAMFARWKQQIAFDPAYNLNLSLGKASYEIEVAPALTWPPDYRPLTRILAHPADQEGCGEYRIKAPMRALIASGKVQGWETGYYLTVPELMRMSPDSIVLQRQITDRQIAMMEEYFDFSDAFRIFELDDLMTNIQLQNQARKNFLAKDLVKRFRYALDRCDRFVVSTDALAEEYRKYKREIVVVPNTIERAIWGDLKPLRRQGRKPRVGWVGSPTHAGDLAIIADVVKALKDEVEWVFFGLCPEGVRPLVEYHAFVPIDQYPAKMASLNLDLALAPLEDVPFNHAKSHLRLLEYGMLGYPVICTDITPYRGDYPVVRVRNRYKEWVDAIREELSDLEELGRRGERLRSYVLGHWLLEDNLEQWLRAWSPD